MCNRFENRRFERERLTRFDICSDFDELLEFNEFDDFHDLNRFSRFERGRGDIRMNIHHGNIAERCCNCDI